MTFEQLRQKSNLWHLKQCPLFANLEERELNELFDLSKVVSYDQKQTLNDAVKDYENLWVIKRGHVQLIYNDPSGNESIVMILGPGDIFGFPLNETHAADGSYSEVPKTMSSVCICKLPYKRLERMMERYPNVNYTIHKATSQRIRKLQIRMADMLMRSAEERLALCLLDLREIDSTKNDDGTYTVNFPISQRELSQLIGSSREMVTKIMKKFKEQGTALMEKRIITIKDVVELKKLAAK